MAGPARDLSPAAGHCRGFVWRNDKPQEKGEGKSEPRLGVDNTANFVAQYDASLCKDNTVSRVLVAVLAILIMIAPLTARAGCAGMGQSAYWSNLIHEENSIVASVLYIPYLLLMPPLRMIDGIINPRPASQSTTPPAAHRVPQ